MTDWSEKPGQRIFWARHARHNGQDGPIDLPPGADHAFSPGPHHGHYSYTVAGIGEPPERKPTMESETFRPDEDDLLPFPPHIAKAPPKISKPQNPSPKLMTKAELLDRAKDAVAGRGRNYGKPETNFERIAARWRAHIKNRFGLDVAIDAASVAMMCADIKLARLENQPAHLDSWTDLAGYAACGAEITNGE